MTKSDKSKAHQQSPNPLGSEAADKNRSANGRKPTAIVTVKEQPKRLDPTRYGDWEKNGRAIDF